jgi:hypothetical protein
MERNPKNNKLQDRQLQRLAGQMRDTGVAPNRDLWPDINAAIDLEESRPRSSRPRPANPWRLAAVAAALVLMLAAGWVGIGSITGEAVIPGVAEDSVDQESGLAVIDRALDELNLALADDPENRSLSQLVLMVHKTRGSLMRKNSGNILRD